MRLALCALALTSLYACTTTVLFAKRDPALSAPITSALLVAVAPPLKSSAAIPTVGTLLGYGGTYGIDATSKSLTDDAHAMVTEAIRQLPAALQAGGLTLAAPPILTREQLANDNAVQPLLPAGYKGPVLTIAPYGAKMDCPGACFEFIVHARLLSEEQGKLVWSATFQMPSKASRFSDFSAPVANFAQALVTQMKKDGVLR